MALWAGVVALLTGTAAPALAATLPALGSPHAALVTAPLRTADPDEADPLQVRIEQMSPTVVTSPREVVISGTVTNASEETWIGINVAPFRSTFPITDSSTLNAAADLPDDEFVGERLTAVETLHKIESLEPGESAPFTARIPQGSLSTAPGVYWVGVHARGETATQPRDVFTDGRARTFLPVAPEGVRPLPTAVVVPLRAPVRHTPDGRIDDTDTWATLLGPGGRLAGLLDVAGRSDGRELTWLIDPAVLHAVSRLAAGNPGFSLEAMPTPDGEGEEGEDEPDAESTPTLPVLPSLAPADDNDDDNDSAGTEDAALATLASDWLARFRDLFAGADVLALPYGDLDVSALIDTAPASVAAAHERSAEVLGALGVQSRPALASHDGYLSRQAVENSPGSALVLLGERALSSDGAPVPTTGTILGRDFAATSAGVAQGGPGPEPAGTAVAVRQRAASEAVLRNLSGDDTPLVIAAPADWNAATGAQTLFELLDTRRFRVRSLETLVDGSQEVVSPGSIVYTAEQRREEIPVEHVEASTALVARALTFESVLTQPAGLDVQVRDVSWTDLSLATRRRPALALERIDATQEHLDDQLSSITISGPALATMSGDSGNIGATVINGLDVPVTVNVEVDSSADLEVRVPNPIKLAPESRRRLLLPTRTSREGVQTLTLRVADAEGIALGHSTKVPVRASEVGGLLWLIMGAGAIILFGAIAFRLFRRGLASRRDQGAV